MCSDGALSYRTSSKRCMYCTRTEGRAVSSTRSTRAAVRACLGRLAPASPVATKAESSELSAWSVATSQQQALLVGTRTSMQCRS